MSLSCGSTWPCLFRDKQSQFVEQGCELAPEIHSETAFRGAFERLCGKRREKYPDRLYSRISPSYSNISKLAEAVGGPVQGLSSNAIPGMIWGGSFAAIEASAFLLYTFHRWLTGSQCTCKAGAILDGLLKMLANFHEAVPAFDKDMSLYPDDPSVQKPLQDMVSVYVDFYISMASLYTNRTSKSRFDPTHDVDLKTNIKEAAGRFEETKIRFDSMLEKAKQRALERPPKDLATRQKAPYLTNGVDYTGHHVSDVQARFVSVKTLGRGRHGEVDAVEEITTKRLYARKHIHSSQGSILPWNENEDEILNEIAIMQKLRHPNIASILFYVKETAAYSIIMLPVADCNLEEYLNICIRKHYNVSNIKPIYSWFGSLVDALSFAHGRNVKHRDIKPANILIKDHAPYLTDFGLAEDFTEQDTSASRTKYTEGTLLYYPPETKIGSSRDLRGRPADVFSLGCVFSEMQTVNRERSLEAFKQWRKAPENDCGPFAFCQNLPKVREWLKNFPEGDTMSDMLVDQIQDMLTDKPQQRAKAQNVVDILKRNTAFFCSD